MPQIKYSYCLDEKNQLVHIKSLTDATRHAHRWRCLQCGQEMVANLGQKNAWYFSHKADTACDGESYLHKLAKRRIREKFMSEESFPITFVRDVPCKEHDKCPFFSKYRCSDPKEIGLDLKIWNNKIVYDICEEEKSCDNLRADLLLTNSCKPNYNPTFIEIYKTHKCDELKLNSNNRIIETHQIKSEEDIDDIINRGFIEGENCQTHNFNPPFPPIRKNGIPIERFLLSKEGKATVIYAGEHLIYCDEVFQKCSTKSTIELNVATPDYTSNLSINLTSHEKGLLYLMRKNNLQIRNCILCKYNRYNDYHSGYICILYKKLGLYSPFPGQTRSKECEKFELNQGLMNYPLSDLENKVFEVPT